MDLHSVDVAKLFCMLRELEIYSDQDICEFLRVACEAKDLDLDTTENGVALLNPHSSGYGAKLAIRFNEVIDPHLLEYTAIRLQRLAAIRKRYTDIKNHQAHVIMNKLAPVEDDVMSVDEVPEIVDQDYNHISPQDSDEEYGIPTKRRASFLLERPEKRIKLNEVKQWHLLAKRVVKHAKRFPKTFNVKHLNAIKDVAKHQISHVDLLSKCKQLAKDVGAFIRKKDKVEREQRKKVEKEQFEKAKAEEEQRESQRQNRKLNFLLTQTEIYSHFVGSKDQDVKPSDDLAPVDFDNDDEELLRQQAVQSAQTAFLRSQENANAFNHVAMIQSTVQQPSILKCQLKSYQLKGLNWLAGLYEQGINGILADEMGLGKTVQSISLLAYVAEKYDIWGPFLIVTPSSTLHNWQSEFAKFIPDFRSVPYWGNSKERASMRHMFRTKGVWNRDSKAHVIITSYQLAVQDQSYLSKIKWQFLILDEAHSIKSSSSVRWNTLLKFNCRNRLLLTGTPIQNTLQELWSLLHFIMPTLFDNHQEFAEWFSKGIESDSKGMNEHQLKRLQAILKPFMLRRVKSDVENELPAKVELELPCPLTHHQRRMYRLLKKRVNLQDLLEKANLTSNNSKSDETLMNLMMHFRKITNHPELFERSDVVSPLFFGDLSLPDFDDHKEFFFDRPGWLRPRYPRLLGEWLLEEAETKRLFKKHTFVLDSPEFIKGDFLDWTAGFSQKRLVVAKMLSKPQLLPCSEFRPLLTVRKQLDITPFYMPAVVCGPIHISFGSSVIDRLLFKDRDGHLERLGQLVHGLPMAVWERKLSLEKQHSKLDPMEQETIQYLYDVDKPNGLIHFEKRQAAYIKVPTISDLVNCSGKLLVLDDLLPRLRSDGHKCLLYFQMTKMMDIMEDYLSYRGIKYVRLDGSTSIEERNEKVLRFQNESDLFVFILSTRAGGVGINLTSADTVIFYDQDWNPTADQQAMDRCHRLGQTKQVTVYRMITKGTIEERVLEMAKKKHDIQKAVIASGEFKQVVEDLLEIE